MTRERQAINMPEPASTTESPSNDWLPLLDAEIQRLPERLRVPLVLCELQGMSRSAVAQKLGIPEGTLSSRLARCRELLRKRLRRRGIVVASAALAAAFLCGFEAISAPKLIETTNAALSGSTSTSVTAISQGVLKTMLIAKLKIVAVVLLVLGTATGAMLTGLHARMPTEEPLPDKKKTETAKADKEQLQGRWEIVSAMMGGKEPEGAEAERIIEKQVTFSGDKVTFKEDASFTIDPNKSPKEIDMTLKVGPERENGVWKGIYKLSDDELTLCFALPDSNRPTEFTSKEGGGDPKTAVMSLKLKRVKQ
jgi:uncharacterized protein (TIGR03067 family)